jgi:threonine dehydratase
MFRALFGNSWRAASQGGSARVSSGGSVAHPRLTLALIREAHARIADKIHRTPVLTSVSLNALVGAQLYFKCENFQKVGTFKARGATNSVFSLSESEAQRGVVTHSSGNHAAALARAAKLKGVPAYIVMPENAPKTKVASVRRYDGHIVFCEATLEARERTARQVIESTGAVLIHPYNDLRVMAGQGTTALELMEQAPTLDLILCPVGGGGLLSGVATAVKALKPTIQVIGVEPAAADDAARSFRAGHIIPSVSPKTVADGLLTSLGDLTFPVIREHVDDIVTVSEGTILRAMRQIWAVMKVIVEPSGAVAYAAIVEGRLKVSDYNVGIILSGGNLDLEILPWQIVE